jgi:RNA polymerase primary sigma factor
MRALTVKNGNLTKRETRSINNYFNELNRFHVLTPDEENELAFRVSQGDEQARQKLIQHNLRFVVSVAKQYETVNHKVEDLINEGNLGLIKAAESFDPTRGFKFISYAVWHIRQKILSYLKDGNMMRIPVNKSTSASKIKRLIAEYNANNDNIPMGYEEETEFLLNKGFKHGDIEFYRRLHTVKPTSLNAPVGNEENSKELASLIEDRDSRNPTLGLEHESDITNTNELMSNVLNEMETYILNRYFGLNGGQATQLRDIGEELEMTSERIRQIKQKALRKLRRKLENQAEWMVTS